MQRCYMLTVTILVSSVFLPSCSTPGTLPRVHIQTNSSGLEVGDFHSHGSGGGHPPGVTASMRSISPLHNLEPRYVISADGTLQVVTVERPESYDIPGMSLARDCLRWKTMLSTENPTGPATMDAATRNQVQEIPWYNAGRCFHAKVRYRKFPWGKAVMFLTTYTQGPSGGTLDSDSLVLVVQGLTDDNRYAVNGHFPIRHSKLPDSTHNKHSNDKANCPLEKPDIAEKWLNGQPDASYDPTFSQYEALLRALVIMPGNSIKSTQTNKSSLPSGNSSTVSTSTTTPDPAAGL